MAKAFHRMTEAELIGRQVKLKREIRNKGGSIFGVGTVMTITGKWKGLEIQQTSICEHCGCGSRRTVRKISFEDLELLPIEEPGHDP